MTDGDLQATGGGHQLKPGWYPHQTMRDTQRYWDGSQWTDHSAPMPHQPSHAPASPTPKVDPSFAWALAATPLLGLVIYYLIPDGGWSTVFLIAAWVGAFALAWADSKRLESAYVDANPATALLLPILYLWSRTKAAKSTPAIPLAWVASAVVYLAVVLALGSVYTYESEEMESEIEKWLADQGLPGATVDCPADVSGRDGEQFDCSAATAAGTLPVVVTLTDDGGYSWQVG
ncbi:DUF2510 domain-containing protein [Nocardioides bigeumensis]|uniref:DUF2510 domain-containing protein n=1 Tax=Nocardioides bigeumensis TaxID=433657 RepID=A0ABP5JH54_9ACTN